MKVSKRKRVSDEKLIKKYARGDGSCFEELVNRNYERIFQFIYRMLGDYEKSRDLCQEVFVRVFEKADRFNAKYRFSTWLYTIAKNLVINEIRDNERHKKSFQITINEHIQQQRIRDSRNYDINSPQYIVINRELMALLSRAMMRLNENERMVLVLKEYEGLSYDEIAAIMETASGTIKSWVYRAKKELVKYMKDAEAF